VNDAVIGVDLGGTNIKSAVVDEHGTVLRRLVVPTEANQGQAHVIDQIALAVNQVRDECDANVIALGAGAPGPMNWQTGVVYSPPNLPGWKNVPLADEISKRTGLPAFVDNDANVACWGEFYAGAGKEAHTLCCFTLGTGVGGGIVVDGALVRGIDGTAGELGHICVMRDGRACGCGARGCLEAYASVTGTGADGARGPRKRSGVFAQGLGQRPHRRGHFRRGVGRRRVCQKRDPRNRRMGWDWRGVDD
jgi:glucokinase